MLTTDKFFLNRFDQLIDLRHPMAVLANRMLWQEIEVLLAPVFVKKSIHLSKRLSPLCLATLHARAAGSSTLLLI